MKSRRELSAIRNSSVHALAALLTDVAREPLKHLEDGRLVASLRTQGTLAAFHDRKRNICAMSLNHQKELAINVLGAYATLDSLRHSALKAIAKAKGLQNDKPSPGSRADLMHRLEIYKSAEAALRCDLTILQRAYDLRCAQAHSYAQAAGGAIVERCKKEQKEIDASFSLLRGTSSASVTNIDEAREARDARKS